MEQFTEIQPSDLSIYYILTVISLFLTVYSVYNSIKARLQTNTDEYLITADKIAFS